MDPALVLPGADPLNALRPCAVDNLQIVCQFGLHPELHVALINLRLVIYKTINRWLSQDVDKVTCVPVQMFYRSWRKILLCSHGKRFDVYPDSCSQVLSGLTTPLISTTTSEVANIYTPLCNQGIIQKSFPVVERPGSCPPTTRGNCVRERRELLSLTFADPACRIKSNLQQSRSSTPPQLHLTFEDPPVTSISSGRATWFLCDLPSWVVR